MFQFAKSYRNESEYCMVLNYLTAKTDDGIIVSYSQKTMRMVCSRNSSEILLIASAKTQMHT